MNKKIKVNTLAAEAEEINGTAKEQRNKFRDLCYVYCKPFSEVAVKECFWHEFEELKIKGKMLCIFDDVFHPPMLSDFVSIVLARGYELFWDEEVYTEFIDRRVLKK